MIFFSLFLTSFSVLTLEIIFAKIFSVLSYYHFSSMIISIAMLGFGAAGAHITYKSRKDNLDLSLIERNLLFFLISIVIVFYLVIKIRFYPLSWDADWTNQISLVFLYLLMGFPFYFAGSIISSLFTLYPEKANTLYFTDMIGAGLGSLSSVFLLMIFPAPLILHLIAIIGLAFMALVSFFKKTIRVASLAFLLLFLFFSYKIESKNEILVHVPTGKSLFKWVKPWSKQKVVEYSKWNIIERLDVTRSIDSKIWGYGGEVSPVFSEQRCKLRYLFKDGIMSSGILKIDKDIKEYEFLSGYLISAPYYIQPYTSAAVIGFGGGIDLLVALYHGVKNVMGIELNPEKVKILEKKYYQYSGKLIDRCILIPWEGRHFLSRWKGKVDVIGTSGLDSYPALSSGAYAMQESYIFTVESVISMLNHLTQNGVITTTRIYFNPPRETLKLVVTMKEALRKSGIANPWRHFLILKGNRWTNTLLKKTPFRDDELEKIKKWASKMEFDFFYIPDEKMSNAIDEYLRTSYEHEDEFIKSYPYRIEPATDNSPFFFQYYKWRHIFNIKKDKWALMPIGLKIVIFSLIQITVLGLIFIGVPLLFNRSPTKKRWQLPLAYYAAIGLGFILIEIVLIQKLNYFLGGPIYALAVTLFTILTFSGLGSYLVRKRNVTRKSVVISVFILICIALFLIFGLNFFLNMLMPLNRVSRIAVSIIVLAPLAIFMGMPFPSGIVRLRKLEMENLIPLAWGVNSIFSVFGSVFCLFVSLNWGLNAAFLAGVAAYVFALLSATRL